MTEAELRSESWNKAFHASGTAVVFGRRASKLNWCVRLRDFIGIAVSIILAYIVGSDVFPLIKINVDFIRALLGVTAILQTLVVVWSNLGRWDDNLGKYISSTRESYLLKEDWKRTASASSETLAIESQILNMRQTLIDSRDIEMLVSDAERRVGYRAALIEFRRECVCGCFPKTTSPPWRPEQRCLHCGGN